MHQHYNPQANGAAERAVEEVMGQLRTMKNSLDWRLNVCVKTDWMVLEWMVELATELINRCLVGHHGKTPFARLTGKNSSNRSWSLAKENWPTFQEVSRLLGNRLS